MIFVKNTVLVFVCIAITTLAAFSQRLDPQAGTLTWDLGPNDPRITIKFKSTGLNIGGSESVSPIITNNFSDTLLVKIAFTMTDHCGESKIYTMPAEQLSAHEKFAPGGWIAGYDFFTSCKQFNTFGSGNAKTKSRIHRLTYNVVTLRNLTQEKKDKKKEQEQKERERALKRQKEEEARQKAIAEREAEEARKGEERKKEAEVREAEEAKRKAEAAQAANTANAAQQQASSETGTQQSGASGSSTAPAGNTSATNLQQDLLAQQQEAERVAEEKRAAHEAEMAAAEEAHQRVLYEKHMADMRRKEQERLAEEQRQKELQQKRVQFRQDAQAVETAKTEAQELQRLNLNHSNIEQMEQEYARKLSELTVAMNNLEKANEQKWNSAVQSTDWGTESYSQDMGELMQATGAMVNSMGAAKRSRQARENLARQRKQFLIRVENEKAQMRFNLRTEMLKNFPAYKIPATGAPEPTRVYGFYVLYNYNELAAERTALTVSNIAEIGTYTDGTWPSLLFFRTIEEQEKKQFQYCYFHSNGYSTRAEAEQMKQAMVKLFSKNGTVAEKYVESSINPANQRMDFWESGVVPQK